MGAAAGCPPQGVSKPAPPPPGPPPGWGKKEAKPAPPTGVRSWDKQKVNLVWCSGWMSWLSTKPVLSKDQRAIMGAVADDTRYGNAPLYLAEKPPPPPETPAPGVAAGHTQEDYDPWQPPAPTEPPPRNAEAWKTATEEKARSGWGVYTGSAK